MNKQAKFAVIFRATVNQFDEEYSQMAITMRNIAIAKYNCVDFVAVTEGANEIAISYWENEQDIINWKQDKNHKIAQKKGQNKWYKNYLIQIVDIKRQYKNR